MEEKKKAQIFDARGNGGGDISPTITGDHQNRITDYTAIIVEYEEGCKQSVSKSKNSEPVDASRDADSG